MKNEDLRFAREGEERGYAFVVAPQPGVRRLRFAEPLESTYRAVHMARCRARVRFWQLFLIATGFIYGVSRLHPGALGQAASVFEMLTRFAVLLPAWGVLAWLAWSPRYDRQYLPVAQVLVPLTGCLVSVVMSLVIVGGRGEALSGLSTHMLGLMFLSGLLFRQALWTCGATLLAFMLAALYDGYGLAKLLLDLVAPLVTVGVGGFVYYEIEKANRSAFLELVQAADQAASDGLTGLKNRRTFDEHLRRLWRHAGREDRNLALLLVDADEFKRYNDRYGHQAGDGCLQRLAQAVKSCTQRPLDLAARFGGEEFAVILYDYDLNRDQTTQLAEKLRSAIEALAIEHLDSAVAPTVTVSIGAACVRAELGRRCEGLIQLADEALYAAKRGGRNRVIVRDEEYATLDTGEFRNPALPMDSGSAAP